MTDLAFPLAVSRSPRAESFSTALDPGAGERLEAAAGGGKAKEIISLVSPLDVRVSGRGWKRETGSGKAKEIISLASPPNARIFCRPLKR